jgi:hypothetical protein
VPESKIQKILTGKAGGKSGKLSDLINRVEATRALDHLTEKIRGRGNQP